MLFLLVGSLFLLHGMKHFWNESLGLCSMDNALWKVMQHQISLFKSHAERDVDVPGVGEECGNSEMLQVLVWIVVTGEVCSIGMEVVMSEEKKKDCGTLGVYLSKTSHLLPLFHEFCEVTGLSSILTKVAGCEFSSGD